MDAQKLVDAFVELQENEKTYIKKYGQEKYNELYDKAKKYDEMETEKAVENAKECVEYF